MRLPDVIAILDQERRQRESTLVDNRLWAPVPDPTPPAGPEWPDREGEGVEPVLIIPLSP